jgi:methylated-DNA-protein-cysteine methyltransferase related protein
MPNRIIAAIQQVPRGHVSTYGAIAKAAGYPRGARLVARTLRGSFGLPWHRILGAGGEIKLRGDSAMDQRLRLEMEGVTFRGRRVNMRLHEFKFGAAEKNKGKPQRARRATAENAERDLTAKGAKGARKSRRKAGKKL